MKREKILKGIPPSAAIEALYRQRLKQVIEAMHRSVLYYVKAAYRANPPELLKYAADESPTVALQRIIRDLAKRWTGRINAGAEKLAKWFARSIGRRSDASLKKILKDAGVSVDWKLSREMNDVLQASIAQNVSLIKSIPSEYFTQIEGMVMRSVARGNDLKQLTDDLEQSFNVSRKRAEFIAQDQTSKANANMVRTRQLGVMGPDAVAIWVHSHAGREPRPTHVAAGRNQVRFKVAEGWHDPNPQVNRRIQPGELPRCRCMSRLVIPGFS